MGKSLLEIGQEASVRVLRITRGQAALNMRKEGADEVITESTSQQVQ